MPRDHPDHDQIFKELLHGFLPEFLLLVAPHRAQKLKLEHGTFLNQEAFLDFPEGELRRLDVVYRTDTLGNTSRPVLVHVEVESEFRRSFDARMTRYGMALHLRSNASIFPIALFLRGGGDGGESSEGGPRGLHYREAQVEGIEGWVYRFRYLTFSLSAASAEEYLDRKGPLAAALAALMPFREGSPAEHKLRCLKGIAQTKELNPARSFQLANIVETYIQLDAAEEEKYRRLRTKNIDQEVKAMEMTWADKMFARWHDQGLEDGRKEGSEQAARQILLRQLGIRFGNLPQATRQQVAACTDLDQLHHWTDQVLTAPDLAAMGLDTAR